MSSKMITGPTPIQVLVIQIVRFCFKMFKISFEDPRVLRSLVQHRLDLLAQHRLDLLVQHRLDLLVQHRLDLLVQHRLDLLVQHRLDLFHFLISFRVTFRKTLLNS